MSTEFNRRHYGIVADEQPLQRLSTPQNIQRRIALQTGIYEAKSAPIPVAVETPKKPADISLIPLEVDTWAVEPWQKGIGKASASGVKLIKPVDVMVVPQVKPPVEV